MSVATCHPSIAADPDKPDARPCIWGGMCPRTNTSVPGVTGVAKGRLTLQPGVASPSRRGLAAGYNVVRLAMGSPFFAGGSGTVNLGYLQLG